MAQVLAAFQEEQAEHRQAAGEILLELERIPNHPQRQPLLDQLFREAHSLKGGARAAAQPEIEQVAHRIEDLFSAVRQGNLDLTPDICDPVYAALDAIGVLMAQVLAEQPVDLAPYASLLDTLAAHADRAGAQPALTPPAAKIVKAEGTQNGVQHNGNGSHNGDGGNLPSRTSDEMPHSANGNGKVHAPQPVPEAAERQEEATPVEELPQVGGTTIRIPVASLDSMMNETGELITCSLRAQQHARDASELSQTTSRWRRVWRQIRPVVSTLQGRRPSILPAVHYLQDRHEVALPQPKQSNDHEVERLLAALQEANDLIENLDSRLLHHGQRIAEDSAQLSSVVDRLHTHIRRTRMVALRTIFSQIRLQGRDMARSVGKSVTLTFDDGEAEADREILERLRDVLLHLLRNAIDHGIETPDARIACGKPAQGQITLRAAVDGERLVITMEDDGAGIDLQAVKRRAATSGMVSESDLARMQEAELLELIFLPGLSTRKSVSTLSGRGVGLDIVRSHVDRMRGRVDVRSASGVGCTFTLSVPLSLTSMNGLIVQADNATFALPLDGIQRIVTVQMEAIQTLEGRTVLVQDGRPLPVAHLADVVDTSAAMRQTRRTYAGRLALLLGNGERQVACLVDAVIDEQDIVTHRLPVPLQEVQFISGATILPDGSVVPILDIADLLHATSGSRRLAHTVDAPEARPSYTILVVDDSITTRTLEKNILESAGYRVRLATDGVEALQLLDQLPEDGRCDLLLSDVDMPHLNGFDLTAQVRATSRFQNLPIVLVTSLDTPQDRERGIAAGADAYIVKRQFDQQGLLETIAQLL